MYRANQLWIVGEEDLKDLLTPRLTLEMLPGRTMVLCENAEEVDKWARRVPDSAGFRIFQREITGTARQVQTRLVLCCQPKLEAMYYVAE